MLKHVIHYNNTSIWNAEAAIYYYYYYYSLYKYSGQIDDQTDRRNTPSTVVGLCSRPMYCTVDDVYLMYYRLCDTQQLAVGIDGMQEPRRVRSKRFLSHLLMRH